MSDGMVGECAVMKGDEPSPPFLGSEAVKDGTLRPHQLRSQFRAVFPDVYVRRDQQPTLRVRAVAAWLWSHRKGVLAGLTAAALHGSKWVDQNLPVELVWSNARPPRGLRTYDFTLLPEEVRVVAGVPLTTPERTAFDIGRRKATGMAIAHLDALMRATGTKADEVLQVADRHRGARGAQATGNSAGASRSRFTVAQRDVAAPTLDPLGLATGDDPDPGDD